MMFEAGKLLNEGDTVKYNGHIFRVEKAAKPHSASQLEHWNRRIS
jgi:hypothetical protein